MRTRPIRRLFWAAGADFSVFRAASALALASLLLVLPTGGCTVYRTPSSVVVPQLTNAAGPANLWLESATLTYAVEKTAGEEDVSEVNQASHWQASTAADTSLHLLAIRYPHPEGRAGMARIEAIVVDSEARPEESSNWLSKIGRTLSNTLPGVSLGAGIRQARALDISAAELQQVLTEARAADHAAAVGTAERRAVNLVGMVNDQHHFDGTSPVAALDALAARVLREGKLVSFDQDADELRNNFPRANQAHQFTPPSPRRLPVVTE